MSGGDGDALLEPAVEPSPTSRRHRLEPGDGLAALTGSARFAGHQTPVWMLLVVVVMAIASDSFRVFLHGFTVVFSDYWTRIRGWF